jgi:hypothetical protein
MRGFISLFDRKKNKFLTVFCEQCVRIKRYCSSSEKILLKREGEPYGSITHP